MGISLAFYSRKLMVDGNCAEEGILDDCVVYGRLINSAMIVAAAQNRM